MDSETLHAQPTPGGTAPAEAPPWVPRKGAEADLPDLVRIFNQVFRKSAPEEHLRWKYHRNPHGPTVTWVAESPGRGIVGAYSYVARRLAFGAEEAPGIEASDAMVLTDFQRRGIFVALDKKTQTDSFHLGVQTGFAFEGRQSTRGFRRAGWQAIGSLVRFELRVGLAPRLRGIRILGPLLGAVAGPSTGIARMRLRARCDRALVGFAVESVESPGEEFDRLWSAARARLGRIAVCRDSAYLRWRYFETPSRRHRMLALRRGGALAGFGVVECSRGARAVEGHVVDALAADPADAPALLAAAVRHLLDRKAERIVFGALEGHPYLPAARALGFAKPFPARPYGTEQPFIVKMVKVGKMTAQVLDPDHWFVLEGDRDDEFVGRGEPA